MSRVQGTVKWFSNKKGYGFIEPTPGETSIKEDVFVHQSSVASEGYRTLIEGWIVEFETITDDDGKIKAHNVTALGGGPCTGPRKPRKKKEAAAADGEVASSKPKNSGKKKEKQWHDGLEASVKEALTAKSIRHSTGTLDVSTGDLRIKLGTRGYTSMAHADALLAEGTFESNDDGMVIFTWQHAIRCDDGEWQATTTDDLLKSLTLSDDGVTAVGVHETPELLWGPGKPDPHDALEANEFQMRRVMLTPKTKNGGK